MYQSSDERQSDKLGIIKNWLEDNQRTIVLVVGIVLIGLISFGLGRLTAVQKSQKPVIIEDRGQGTGNSELGNSEQAASVGAAVAGDAGQGNNNSASSTINPSTSSSQTGLRSGNNDENGRKIIVASKSGTKYHWPWCSWAKKIKPENQVWFTSEAEAQKAGYQPCSAFQKLAPAGYKP